MKRITFLTYGTRGDVEPFLALAHQFAALGYEVHFAAPVDFQTWVEGDGFAFSPTTKTPISDLVANPSLEDLMHFHVFKIRKALESLKHFMHETIVEMIPRSVPETDLIIAHAGLLIASDIAEMRGAKLCYLSPIPAVQTQQFPMPPISYDLGIVNKLTYLPLRFARSFTPSLYKEARAHMGLAPCSRFLAPHRLHGAPVPVLHIYSAALLPPPPDWPAHALVTGQLFYEQQSQNWQMPPALAAFLANGPAPVYIGFGSMNVGQADDLVESALLAARATNSRVLLSKGWAGLNCGPAGRDVLMIDDTPHRELFRHVKAVVHHGGAGTTAAGLRAGRPTLICPFGFDQPWWGALIHKKGLGPAPLPQKKLTPALFKERFVDLISTADYEDRAAKLGAIMGQENGVQKTAQTILQLFGL